MNKHRYRIVFNKTRGILMAVCESAARHADGSRAGGKMPRSESPYRFVLRPGCLAVCLLVAGTTGFLPYANAQIAADPNAAGNLRPQVLNAANGVPLVNIQAPSSAGVSRNVYRQFDVAPQGVILNNAVTNTASQLGGWVQGNPNLIGGAARVILNEVNSSNPSILRGYLEVAGSRAQVVVANPAGITCDGCGFINTERATLTTGTPIMNGGSLDGYRVTGGQIVVQGNGLDTSQTDYTDLIARSVQVNAGIWARALRVTTGANQVDAGNTTAARIAGNGPATAFAIDVAQLGGMYAGIIHLVGTEAGVGMKNAGSIGASAGDVRLTVDGQLINSGTLSASQNLALHTRGLDNAGTLTAQTDIDLNNPGDLANNGLISASRELKAETSGRFTNSGTFTGQRLELSADSLDNTGSLRQTGSQGLAIETQSVSNTGNAILGHRIPDPLTPGTGSTMHDTVTPTPSTSTGGDSLGSATAPQWILADGRLTLRNQLLNRGSLTANGLTTLQAAELDNAGTVNVDQLAVSGQHFNNRGGALSVTDLDVRILTLDNTAGDIFVGNHLSLAAQQLDNTRGRLQHTGSHDLSIELPGDLINTQGLLGSNANTLTLAAARVDNTGGRIAHLGEDTLTLTTPRFDGRGGSIYSTGKLIPFPDHR